MSGDFEAAASGVASNDVAFSEIAETILTAQTPVDNRLCSARLMGSCRANFRHSDKLNFLVVSLYVLTDCSPDAIKNAFLQKLYDLIHTARHSEIVILAENMSAKTGPRVRRGPFGLDSCSSENGE